MGVDDLADDTLGPLLCSSGCTRIQRYTFYLAKKIEVVHEVEHISGGTLTRWHMSLQSVHKGAQQSTWVTLTGVRGRVPEGLHSKWRDALNAAKLRRVRKY